MFWRFNLPDRRMLRGHLLDIIRVDRQQQPALWAYMVLGLVAGWLAGLRDVLVIAVFLRATDTVVTEIQNRYLDARGSRQIPLWMVGTYFLCSTAAVICHMLLGIALAGRGDVALLLLSLIWSLGAMVHIGHIYANYIMFNAYQMLLVVGSIGVQMHVISQRDYSGSSSWAWWLCGIALFFFLGNIVQHVLKFYTMNEALSRSQKEALRRLSEVEHLSRHDCLTGLMNRRALDAEVEAMLDGASKVRPVVVFLIDLDHFKPINDIYGHAAGDRLLQHVAQQLNHVAPNRAITARTGGDEFIQVWHPKVYDPVEVQEYAKALRRSIRHPMEWNGTQLSVNCSVGVAITRDLVSVSHLYAVADRAMYSAKARGRRDRRADLPAESETESFGVGVS